VRSRNDLVFPITEYDRRLEGVRSRMAGHGIDVLLVATPENITYLTGFESPGHYWFQGLVVPLEGEPATVSRTLEQSGVDAYTWIERNVGYLDSEDPIERVADTLRSNGFAAGRIGFEKDAWFFTAAQQERLFGLLPDATFVDVGGIVEHGRLRKSDLEIDLIREAARAAEAGMRAGVDAVAAGATENDVAAEMHWAMIKAGSEWPSIQPFVASGERGAIGHATWMGREIQPGDSVFLEIGGCRRRYHAAFMRTCVVGEPDAETRRAFEIVLEAFDAATAAIAPGVAAGEVDRVAREAIAASGFGGTQASRTAYSIGIAVPPDWGEGQILSMKPGETRELEENMTFHLLPWVQIPGKAGVGCTETIRVTASGCERITSFPRELFVR
jgi:Xaa-Pro dipeptidase